MEDIKQKEAQEEWEYVEDFEVSSPHDDIGAALNVLYAVADIDKMLTTDSKKKKLEQMERWCFNILYKNIKIIHRDTGK